MAKITPPHVDLSRRERQIMDIVHRRARATVAEIQDDLGNLVSEPVTYSAVRSALRLLRNKGALCVEHDGKRYVYLPVVSRSEAQHSALRHLMRTFFEGSRARTVSAILDFEDTEISDPELERLEALVREARQRQDES